MGYDNIGVHYKYIFAVGAFKCAINRTSETDIFALFQKGKIRKVFAHHFYRFGYGFGVGNYYLYFFALTDSIFPPYLNVAQGQLEYFWRLVMVYYHRYIHIKYLWQSYRQ